MAADRPPVPIYMLDCSVDMGYLTDKPGRGWSKIPCASRRAYGCGKNIQEAVEGLMLYARLSDTPLLTSSLAIRMTIGAHRRFESELDPDHHLRYPELPPDLKAYAEVEMAEEQGITIIVLSLSNCFQSRLCYYLVYDAIDRSLSMFQILPDTYKGICTLKPIVPERSGSGSGSGYQLLLLGHDEDRSSVHEDVLWVGSLAPDGAAAVPSMFKSMCFPPGEIQGPFEVDMAFSFQGKGFWGDLEQGLVYCDLQTGDCSDMDFGFVKLPHECKAYNDMESDEPRKLIRITRTMGRVGNSIWFVFVDTPSHYTNDVVTIWELELPLGQGKKEEWQWKKIEKVPAKVLWELSSFKEAGLPAAPLEYPLLTADGALCFVLDDRSTAPRPRLPLVDHFCSFDMLHKRLLWHGLVHNYPFIDSVIMYPSPDFLKVKQLPPERSFTEDCPTAATAGVEAMAVSEFCISFNS